ncbi:MAG: hypothetical protein M1819_002030 [Sarea resinae]|nr:MAG: hypothetical protein M1819_002030 [Sarea resinae]
MARLNEPAPPATESLEALKRRFVRQNREIARANSTQSLRIRNLESETSRLLAENISLREQIIKLQSELDNNNKNRRYFNHVEDVKDRLAGKMAELGFLVSELGELQKLHQPKDILSREKATNQSPKRSPDQRNWKSAFTLSEITGQDGKLPPIAEDKYYPRRTLDHEELGTVVLDPHVESPDLGPPPVAHLDEGDPIKFLPENKQDQQLGCRDEEIIAALAPNLETRRKRRDSSKPAEFKRIDEAESQVPQSIDSDPASDTAAQPKLKAGAKRKFSSRDEAEQLEREAGSDDFTFNRRSDSTGHGDSNGRTTTSRNTSKGSKTAPIASITSTEKSRGTKSTVAPSGRKALGPKSINTDPVVSPVKASRTLSEKAGNIKKDSDDKQGRPTPRERRRKIVTVIEPPTRIQERPSMDTIEGAPPDSMDPSPETPAGLDLFSPTASEPSAVRQESRDTPPPPDLNPSSSSAEALNAAGRTARRQRTAVSYAEPNLRDKMRRPTKELIDAVAAEKRSQQQNGIKTENVLSTSEEPGSTTEKKMRTVVIKREDTGNSSSSAAWKSLPPASSTAMDPQKFRADESSASPLGNKSGIHVSDSGNHNEHDLPSTVITSRRRRTSSALHCPPLDEIEASDPDQDVHSDKKSVRASGSAAAISALIASSKKPRDRRESRKGASKGFGGIGGDVEEATVAEGRDDEEEGGEDGDEERDGEVDIFEFRTSSPVENPSEKFESSHSSRSRISATSAIGSSNSAARASRRHSSVPAAGSSASTRTRNLTRGLDAPESTSTRELRTARSVPSRGLDGAADLSDDGDGGGRGAKAVLGASSSRAERSAAAASRRRSMML